MTLRPLGTAFAGVPTPNALPHAGPVINCRPMLRHLPHYSKKRKDVSWHWDWTCDGDTHATATSVLQFKNFPFKIKRETETGMAGDFNVRYKPCYKGFWRGYAHVIFSAPGYTSAYAEEYSPEHRLKCR